jgi:hypothetical protein
MKRLSPNLFRGMLFPSGVYLNKATNAPQDVLRPLLASSGVSLFVRLEKAS